VSGFLIISSLRMAINSSCFVNMLVCTGGKLLKVFLQAVVGL